MNTWFALALAFCATLCLTGCPSTETANSTDVKQSEIYQNYQITCQRDAVNASATFRFGGPDGTTLALKTPSRVTYNGQEMTKSEGWPVGGTYYGLAARNFPSQHRFEFTDANNKIYANSIALAPLEWTLPPARLRRSVANNLTLSRPLTQGEQVAITVTDKKDETHNADVALQTASVYYDAAKRRVVLTPQFMQSVAPGPATVNLQVTRTQEAAQATHLGGKVTVTYTAQEVTATVSK